jgi:ABC-type lipoprotein release transport system permease subunit
MTLRIAFKALSRNKLRTVLTMLGMIIGVAAVIAMVALGNGATAMIEEAIKAQGTNLITINPGSFSAAAPGWRRRVDALSSPRQRSGHAAGGLRGRIGDIGPAYLRA